MRIQEPLKYCRYYHGEDACPAHANSAQRCYWEVERIWVKGVNSYEDHAEQLVAEFSMDYPKGIPSADIPISLKALMYDQYCHWNPYKDGFIDFIRYYLSYSL